MLDELKKEIETKEEEKAVKVETEEEVL